MKKNNVQPLLSCSFRSALPSTNDDFPIFSEVFLWFSYDFLLFPWFSHDFPIFSEFSYGKTGVVVHGPGPSRPRGCFATGFVGLTTGLHHASPGGGIPAVPRQQQRLGILEEVLMANTWYIYRLYT